MSNVPTAVVIFTWLDDAMLPVPVSASVPPSMLVTPVYVFVPLSVCVPAASVSPPVPPMRPAYVDEPFEIVRVRLPNATWLLATPLSVATIASDVVAEMSNVPAAFATLTWLYDAMLPVPLNANVPALIVVSPV
jgi:hypothetical protein